MLRKKVEKYSCQINDQYKLLSKTSQSFLVYQGYTEQKRQNSSEDMNVTLNLYRLILGKYSYTSVELAVRKGCLDGFLTSRILLFLIRFGLFLVRTRKNGAYYYGSLKL
jgi:hypothetical protein